MARNPTIEFDRLQMYFGEPYVIDCDDAIGTVTVYTPTIGDIVHVGEQRFYQTLNFFTCNTTQYRVLLWDIGIDWNVFPDFSLFCMFYKQIDHDVSKLLFGDLDFSKFEIMSKYKSADDMDDEDAEAEMILWNKDDEIEINSNVYNHFSQYIRAMFNIPNNEKITSNDTMKQWYINKDKRAIEREKDKEQKGEKETISSIQPLISSCVNHPGFKYKLHELKEVGVCEFYDSVNRLQIYESSTALMKGMYSGFIDGSKIKPEDYNFMREIIIDTNNSKSKIKQSVNK